ncbi:transposase [Olleya sp. UBA1516]|uniref:transposase n=1 Tax=Olleya sp. UBA1516 TaxID=1947013 RepID=UPI0025DA4C2C|nr:transposase [Olleya sp. UBA1516]|tara:strand:- start:3917 stop:4477 length:561 start_codon:yes stop_codon:yes gene_type:complete
MKYEPLVEDTYYHIYNRGNNKEDLFIEERNYNYFLQLMKKHITSVCSVLSYCLLKNHFHFVVKTKENIKSKEISQAFSNLFNAYSKSINKKYNRTGSLFQDRFSRKKIEGETYLKNLILYVHLNPVHHGFIADFSQYKYSSYQVVLSNSPTKLNRTYVLSLFEDRLNFIKTHSCHKINNLEEYYLE